MSSAPPSGGPKKQVMWAILLVGLSIFIYKFFFEAAPEEQAGTAPVTKPIVVDGTNINQITGLDKDAALAQFTKQLESMKSELQKQKSASDKAAKERDSQIREMQQQNNSQIRTLVDEMAKVREDAVKGVYNRINEQDKSSTKLPEMPSGPLPIPSGGLSFEPGNMDIDLGPSTAPSQPAKSSNPYGPNYYVLKPQPQATYKGKSGGGQGSQSESELFAEMSAPDANAADRANAQASNNMDQTFNDIYGRPQTSPKPVPAAQPVTLSQDQIAAAKAKKDKITIPAFSFVEVTTLHGVACPIGANAPGKSDASKIPARPIVLPVRGIFRGPNGKEVDLGTIHLAGLCSGRRTASSATGRATISVEQLSYWDAGGGPQLVTSKGYIVDTRDNEQDVYGKLEKASGRSLALQAASAAAAAYATTLSSAEFTNTSSLQNGTSSATSQLTGDSTKAAVSQGIGAMFQKISERFEAEADAAVDTILVEGGIRLRYVTTEEISVVKPLEPFDIDASMYDTLI